MVYIRYRVTERRNYSILIKTIGDDKMLAAIEVLEEQTVTEVFEDWTVTYRVIPIIDGVKLHVFDADNEAVLIFNELTDIEFRWSLEAANMFDNIDTVEPIELLELVSRLNRKLVNRV